jgi:hypothetical protein
MHREPILLDRAAVSAVFAASRVSRRGLICGSLFLAVMALAGCASDKGKPSAGGDSAALDTSKLPTAQIKNDDECAGRLHDICEPLLLYYVSRHQLPAHLEDLRQLRGFADLELKCPVSKLPYVYNPVGIITLDNQPRMICYDAAPSHSGMRWAITVVEPRDNSGNLVAKVVAVPESAFTLKLPQ